MIFQLDNSNKKGVLTFDEALTIENISVAKELFMEAFEKTDFVTIQFNHVEQIDLSGIQLFCSAFKTFSETNKILTIGDKAQALTLQKKAKQIGLKFNMDQPRNES